MQNTIVIGGTWAETAHFAQERGMRGVRHVVARQSIKGLRPDVVYLLPGFAGRRDHHAIAAELKAMSFRNRKMQILEVDSETTLLATPEEGQKDDENDTLLAVEDMVSEGSPLILDANESERLLEELATPAEAVPELVEAKKVGPKVKSKPGPKPKPKTKPIVKVSDDFFEFLDEE